jgi:hypothetical protein
MQVKKHHDAASGHASITNRPVRVSGKVVGGAKKPRRQTHGAVATPTARLAPLSRNASRRSEAY